MRNYPSIKYPKYLEKGMKFERLTVIEVDENSKIKNGKKLRPSQWKYKCKCSCGKEINVGKMSLCSGNTRSCGCLNTESRKKIGKANKKLNKIKIEDNIIKILFFNSSKFTIIDSKDYDKVKNLNWYIDKHGYAVNKTKSLIFMHRLIMSPPKDKVIDHINGNPLDNRRCNLRICTQAENLRNSKLCINNVSGHTGVCWEKRSQKWSAEIQINGKSIKLGRFAKKEDAVKKRKEAEIKYFKEFRYEATNNIPYRGYP